jgi:hypothetical protein
MPCESMVSNDEINELALLSTIKNGASSVNVITCHSSAGWRIYFDLVKIQIYFLECIVIIFVKKVLVKHVLNWQVFEV